MSIDEFKKNIGTKSRLLGIDPGKKNIGIAICDENKSVATPFKTLIKHKFGSLLKEISKIIQENEIEGIVIGKAINMDGSLSRSAQSSIDFSKNLSNTSLVDLVKENSDILDILINHLWDHKKFFVFIWRIF